MDGLLLGFQGAAAAVFVFSGLLLTPKLAQLALRDERMFPQLSRAAQREREAAFLQQFTGETDNGRGCVPLASGAAAPFFVAESHGYALPSEVAWRNFCAALDAYRAGQPSVTPAERSVLVRHDAMNAGGAAPSSRERGLGASVASDPAPLERLG